MRNKPAKIEGRVKLQQHQVVIPPTVPRQRFRVHRCIAICLALFLASRFYSHLTTGNSLKFATVSVTKETKTMETEEFDTALITNDEQNISATKGIGKITAKEKLIPDEPCPSLYRKAGGEHSPMLFDRHNLLVCRTAKVGSTEIRRIAMDYYYLNRPETVRKDKSLASLRHVSELNHYIYGPNVTRIMFVRHPVRKILSGWIQEHPWLIRMQRTGLFFDEFGFKYKHRGRAEDFQRWVKGSTFAKQYVEGCSPHSTEWSLQGDLQHIVPPQHCRCGIWDCNVQWKVYKIEEHPVSSVLGELIPGPWISAPKRDAYRQKGDGHAYHSKSYDEREYLTPEVLEILNNITRVEQELFGYEPLLQPGIHQG